MNDNQYLKVIISGHKIQRSPDPLAELKERDEKKKTRGKKEREGKESPKWRLALSNFQLRIHQCRLVKTTPPRQSEQFSLFTCRIRFCHAIVLVYQVVSYK